MSDNCFAAKKALGSSVTYCYIPLGLVILGSDSSLEEKDETITIQICSESPVEDLLWGVDEICQNGHG